MADPMMSAAAFTYNNVLPGFTIEGLADVAYLVYEHQIAPETGRRHLQGYVRFNNRKRFSTVTAWFAARGMAGTHIEKAKGSEEQNRAYCTREETRAAGTEPTEYGVYNPNHGKQGTRTDLAGAIDMLDKGASLGEVARAHAADFVRYHRGFQAYADATRPLPPLSRDVTVYVLWGPTGTGKTHRTLNKFPEIYSVKPGRDPWGMYRQETAIFFDEYDWEKWPLQEMNRYLDKWRCMLDARYADKYAMWTTVIIAANTNPSSWYPQAPQLLLDALRRRMTGRCFLVEAQEPTWEQVVSGAPNPF